MAIVIAPHFTVPDHELAWKFTTSGGPGGQHANKAATRVELTWIIEESVVLTDAQRSRLLSRIGPVLRVVVDAERSQLRNREIAEERLADNVKRALVTQKKRRPTKPTRGSQKRRVEDSADLWTSAECGCHEEEGPRDKPTCLAVADTESVSHGAEKDVICGHTEATVNEERHTEADDDGAGEQACYLSRTRARLRLRCKSLSGDDAVARQADEAPLGGLRCTSARADASVNSSCCLHDLP